MTKRNNTNRIPSLDVLPEGSDISPRADEKELTLLGEKICETFKECGLSVSKIKVQVGFTFYHIELLLEQDTSISQVKELIGSQLDSSTYRVLITKPYLYNYTVGLEIPRIAPDAISIHRLLSTPRYQADERKYIALPLGATILNETFIQSMFLMGSVLIVGQQSADINSMLRAIYLAILHKQLPMNRKVMRKAIDEPLDKFLLRVANEITDRNLYPNTRDVSLFVFIENIDMYYPLSTLAKGIIHVLLTEGEGLNIYSVITARKVENDTLFIHERVRAHCAFYLPDPEDSLAIINCENAAYLASSGECYWQVDNEEPIRLSTPTVSENNLNSVLEQLTWMNQ